MKAFNWTNVTRRLSTLVSVLATGAAGLLAYYLSLPAEIQATWPWWFAPFLSFATPALTALVPVATSYNQRALATDTDSAGA